MGTPTQSPAELIRQSIVGQISEIEACKNIPNWTSDVRVGGFCNIADAPAAIREKFEDTQFVMAWPEGLELPTDESAPGHADAVKAFRKAASKASKKLKKSEPNVGTPFAKVAYNAGSELVAIGYWQVHASLVVDGVKIAVHYWGTHDPAKRRFAKFKIDKDAQLALFV